MISIKIRFTFIFLGWSLFFISCKKEYSCENCKDNKPPIAIAGPDQTLTLPKDSMLLDGTASTDPDGTLTSYQWTKIGGPASAIITTPSLSKTLAKSLAMGVYQFELTVTDNGGLTAKDTVQVLVDNPAVNQAPAACAGVDQAIVLPAIAVTLDGSCSADPDNNITTYTWTKISGPSSLNITNPNAVHTQVTNVVQGVYQFELIVLDAGGLSSKDTMQVLVDAPGNQPPVACAGAGQTITLPVNAVTLDGSCSADPDNNITNYAWTKISGPASFSITNASGTQTQVTNLAEGVYQFELKVTDGGGLFSKDTVHILVKPIVTTVACININRPTINAHLIRVGTLSEPRSLIAVAAAGNKILFNGGYLASCVGSGKVDIYDIAGNTWSVAERPLGSAFFGGSGDYGMAVAVAGSKVFFAGGSNLVGCTDYGASPLLTYDATTSLWDSSQTMGGWSIEAASVGNKILFAGGSSANRATKVDIYNLTTNSWASATLREQRIYGHAAITINNKVYVIGGAAANVFSSTMDIYDNATNAWSTASMQKGRAYFGAIAVNDKLYLAGGQTGPADYSCEVEIIDINTGASVIEFLSRSAKWIINLGQNIVLKDNKIIFLRFDGGVDANKFDIYDITTKSWKIGVLPQDIPTDASVISVNNTIYIAGGLMNGAMSDGVWKLEF